MDTIGGTTYCTMVTLSVETSPFGTRCLVKVSHDNGMMWDTVFVVGTENPAWKHLILGYVLAHQLLTSNQVRNFFITVGA
jgi:hypothetical protein